MVPSQATRLLAEGDRPRVRIVECAALGDGASRDVFDVEETGAPDSILITTARWDGQDPQIAFVNQSFSRMTGYRAEELIGRTLRVLRGPKTDQDVLDRLYKCMARGEVFSGEMVYYRKDGSECSVELRVSPIRDLRGETTHFVSVQRELGGEVVEKGRLEAMVLQAQRMESVGALASALAHDLNSALAPILMALRALEQRFADEESMRWLSLMRKSAERGKDLIERVLAFASGVEGGRGPLQTTGLIGEIARILKETLPENIRLQVHAPNDLWSVIGDATQIRQVLMNLCINARDAMPAGGKLTIRARNRYLVEEERRLATGAPYGPYVSVTVADAGVGIPPGVIDHIFDPFFTTKEKGKGTGLGLSTVLAIVRGHGGFVTLFSKVGKGTEFKVYLPAQAPEAGDCRQQEGEIQPRMAANEAEFDSLNPNKS